MNKLKVLGASVAMALLVASPAAAQNGGFNVESQFLGADTVQFGGFEVENQFFGTDTVQFGGAGNGVDNDFDEDVFDDNDFDEDVFDD
jgi:hypothetical protein